MKSYVIKPYHMEKKDGGSGDNQLLLSPDNTFELIVITQEEWHMIPDILKYGQVDVDLEQYAQISAELPQIQKPQGEVMDVVPVIVHLGPDVHYVCYRDLDEKEHEVGNRFFLMPKCLILVSESGMFIEEVSRWAKRGILSAPIDLAGTMALQVFRHYQAHSEKLEDMMYHFEEDILKGPLNKHHIDIMTLHKQIIIMKRAINYHQAIIKRFEEINDAKRYKWMDGLHSESDRTLDTIEHTHEMVENLRETYQTAVQNYTNDIMKLLAILATILLPINLMTSFFGMNFVALPLVRNPYGMIYFYIISAVIILTAIIYFWKKKLFNVRHR